MLDPIDDIARFAHVDPVVTESTTIVEGVAMVEKKLDKSLRAAGLEIVNPVGREVRSVRCTRRSRPSRRRSSDQDERSAQSVSGGVHIQGSAAAACACRGKAVPGLSLTN